MKKALIIVAVILVLLILGGATYYFLTKEETPMTGDVTDPFGFSDGATTDSLRITLANGQTTSVPDFTKEPQPAWTSPEAGYRVGGSDESPYHILYFPEDSGFLISLREEPLGVNRLIAEDELKAKLNLPENELCELRIQVATGIRVSETYAGQNLGLSFCPGAVLLP